MKRSHDPRQIFLNRQPEITQDDINAVAQEDVIVSFSCAVYDNGMILKLVFADDRRQVVAVPGPLCHYLRDYLDQAINDKGFLSPRPPGKHDQWQ